MQALEWPLQHCSLANTGRWVSFSFVMLTSESGPLPQSLQWGKGGRGPSSRWKINTHLCSSDLLHILRISSLSSGFVSLKLHTLVRAGKIPCCSGEIAPHRGQSTVPAPWGKGQQAFILVSASSWFLLCEGDSQLPVEFPFVSNSFIHSLILSIFVEHYNASCTVLDAGNRWRNWKH